MRIVRIKINSTTISFPWVNSCVACLCALLLIIQVAYGQKAVQQLDLAAYFELGDPDLIYPTEQQLQLLSTVVPSMKFQPAPDINNRVYWDKIAASTSGQAYLNQAIAELEKAPEVPISDAIYRRANKEGNRGIYKPRYYRTMERLEYFTLAECIENEGRFLSQISTYLKAIFAMKSWLHPNHDDDENGVLEGRRVSIDLGARRFGSDLALAEVLLGDKLSEAIRAEIATQLQKRIIKSYLASCKTWDGNNKWIKSTSNWNSVCTSGSVFTAITVATKPKERLAAIGSGLNSMKYYLSGFGDDGYCSEGAGYWSYGFGHYLYLAQILYDYTKGAIDLFEVHHPEKLNNVGNFPMRYEIQNRICAPFSDGSSHITNDGGFAYSMSAKYFGLNVPKSSKRSRKSHDSYSAAYQLVLWNHPELAKTNNDADIPYNLPNYTYFDDFGIVISRGQQKIPFSIAIKAGHNAENHNHSDVGSYSLVLGDEIVAGDIGAPSYTAGAFDDDNPARSSWGHPVPIIEHTLQSNGINFAGKITETIFTESQDRVVMDLKSAYEIPALKSLVRTMTNDKSNLGTITIEDTFSSNKPLTFGTVIMTLDKYKVMENSTVMLYSDQQTVKVEIRVKGGNVKIIDEEVPVKHLREGAPAYRIGIDFTAPLKEGTIVVKYIPVGTANK